LIQHVFSPSSPGDAAEKRLDPLAQARSTATPVELTIFLQCSALREATEVYLRDISALWLVAKPVAPRIQFQLSNARVGQPYAARLEGKDLAGNPVSICDARLPVDVGLSFDPASGEMRGTPLVDGDYKIALRWSCDGVAEHAGECLLFVNPDPRSLWKQLEPPADDPYFKPHTDAALIAGPGFQIAAASRRGRSHEHVGSFRDDDFFVQHDDASGWSLLIVADGAGSAKNSRWGSKLAVQAAGKHIAAQLSGAFGADMRQALAGWASDWEAASQAMHAPFYRLFQAASKLAVEAIEQEAESQGAAAKDYATTLLAAVVRRDGDETFLATFWMGDGAIAAYGPQGKLRLMGKPDSGEFAGQTRFLDRAALTDPDFGKRLVLGCYSDLKAVMLMTDGISDPRFETDNGLADAAKWDALWDEISPLLAAPEPQKALTDWLTFFTPGHHDDRTIAVLW
ncbi:MAG: PP2C family serine/threonine-protein phosphatase, partial [Polaromonas sp.]|nr:PP2C family serine/threonine-protein phosphatase [Polaromonas sp.]